MLIMTMHNGGQTITTMCVSSYSYVTCCLHVSYPVMCIFLRLERLQRIVSKVQMESGVCEEQLNQLESLLQSVSPP